MATVIVETPDGRSIEITGPSREGALRKAQELKDQMQQSFQQTGSKIPEVITPPEQEKPPVSSSRAFGREATSRFLNNVIGLGNLALNPQTMFGPQEFETRSGAPVQAVESVPLPTGEQVRAGAQAGLQAVGGSARQAAEGQVPSPGQQFQAGQTEQRLLTEREREEAPVATGAGRVAGDVATILSGRAPVARAVERRGTQAAAQTTSRLEPGARRALDRAVNSKAVKGLKRAAGKSAEAGFEGLTLSILNEGDPLETAAYSAGGQAAGSLALGITTTPKGLLGLAGTAAGLTALLQLSKSVAPGGDNFILESTESAFQKIGISLIAGIGAGLVGAGRIGRGGKFGQEFAKDFPRIADAITAIPRGAALSMIQDATNDSRVEPVLDTLARDPEAFTSSQRRRLEKAMKNEDVSLSETLDDLGRDREFRNKLDLITSESGRPEGQSTPQQPQGPSPAGIGEPQGS